MTSSRSFVQRAVLAAALLPPLILTALVGGWAVDVPFMDDWALVDDLERWHNGEERLHHLWRGHDVHRIMVPRAIMLTMAELSGWNLRWQMILTVIIALTFAGFFIRLGRPADDPAAVAPWVLAVSLIVFNFNQWENWAWGWQFQLVLAAAAAATSLILLERRGDSARGLAASVALAFVASYSFASGLAVWLAAGPILISDNGSRVKRLITWLVAAVVVIGSYLYRFRLGSEPIGPHPVGPVQIVVYFLAFLGAPVAGFNVAASAAAGGFAVLGLAAAVLWTLRQKAWRPAALWSSLALMAMGAAGMAALGRASLGLDQALSSRYVNFSNLLWLAVVALGLRWWVSEARAALRLRITVVAAASCLVLGLVGAQVVGGKRAIGVFKTLDRARQGLIEGDQARYGMLFPDQATLEQRIEVLKRLQLSCFRPGEKAITGDPAPALAPE